MDDHEAAEEHRHTSAELILNFSDQPGEVVWRNTEDQARSVAVQSDHCCLIPEGVLHCVETSPMGMVSLRVGRAVLQEWAIEAVTELTVESFRGITSNDPLTPHLLAEFGRMLSEQSHAILVNAVGVTLAAKLLDSFSYREINYARKAASFAPSEHARVVEYMEAHLTEGIKVSVLARHMAMSRTHFTRRFTASFGMGPLQYILRLRVDHALKLLDTGDYRVAEAAYEVGFCDQSHFDRHCRKFYGAPPERAFLT